MRSEQEIYAAMAEAIEAVIGVPKAGLSPTTKLISDLHMESIDTIDLLFEIEKRLDISVNLAAVFQDQSSLKARSDQFDLELQELVDYVLKLTKP